MDKCAGREVTNLPYKPLKLPKSSVNVMGDILRIKFVSEDKFIGCASPSKGLILISTHYPADVQREALLHEIAEYILVKMNCGTWNANGGVNYQLKHDPKASTDLYRIFIESLLDTVQRNKIGKVLFK